MVGHDVDVLYEKIRELSAAVERLEAENERLRTELEDARQAVDGVPESAERSDGDAEGGVFESVRRRFSV